MCPPTKRIRVPARSPDLITGAARKAFVSFRQCRFGRVRSGASGLSGRAPRTMRAAMVCSPSRSRCGRSPGRATVPTEGLLLCAYAGRGIGGEGIRVLTWGVMVGQAPIGANLYRLGSRHKCDVGSTNPISVAPLFGVQQLAAALCIGGLPPFGLEQVFVRICGASVCGEGAAKASSQSAGAACVLRPGDDTGEQERQQAASSESSSKLLHSKSSRPFPRHCASLNSAGKRPEHRLVLVEQAPPYPAPAESGSLGSHPQ